jgi:hypothetical protein
MTFEDGAHDRTIAAPISDLIVGNSEDSELVIFGINYIGKYQWQETKWVLFAKHLRNKKGEQNG